MDLFSACKQVEIDGTIDFVLAWSTYIGKGSPIVHIVPSRVRYSRKAVAWSICHSCSLAISADCLLACLCKSAAVLCVSLL